MDIVLGTMPQDDESLKTNMRCRSEKRKNRFDLSGLLFKLGSRNGGFSMSYLIFCLCLLLSSVVFAEETKKICLSEEHQESCFEVLRGDGVNEPALLKNGLSISGQDFKRDFKGIARFEISILPGETLLIESELPFCVHPLLQERCVLSSKGERIERRRMTAKKPMTLQADFMPSEEVDDYRIRIDRVEAKANPFETGDRFYERGENFRADHLDLYDLPKSCPRRYRFGSEARFDVKLRAGESVSVTNGIDENGLALPDASHLHLYIVKGNRCVAYFAPEVSMGNPFERVSYRAKDSETVTVVVEYDDFDEGYSAFVQSGDGYGYLIERKKTEKRKLKGGQSCRKPLKLEFDENGIAEIEGDALDQDFPSVMPPRCLGRLRPLVLELDLKKGEGVQLLEATHRVLFMDGKCKPGSKKFDGIATYPWDSLFDGVEPADRDRKVYARLEFDAECTVTEAQVDEIASGEGVGAGIALMERGCAAEKCHMDQYRSYRIRLQKTQKEN